MEIASGGRLDHLGRKKLRVGERIGSGRALAEAVEDRLRQFRALRSAAARDGRVLRDPDFLIIGAPKAGTSWLKRALRRHGDIFGPDGEVRYFSHALDRPVEAYLAELAATVTQGVARPIIGEKSPQYLIMDDERIGLCAALFPRVKLICMLREPVERAWSHLRHSPAVRYDLPFLQTRESGVSLETILSYGLYARHLRRWAKHFPPEQFLLVDHSRVMAEPDAVHRQTLEFLGAPIKPLDRGVPFITTPFEPMPASSAIFTKPDSSLGSMIFISPASKP
jgi:hypothetical protein